MDDITFSKINTKNIQALTGKWSWLNYRFGIMGKIRLCDSMAFEFSPNGSDDWFYVNFESAAKIKEALTTIFRQERNS